MLQPGCYTWLLTRELIINFEVTLSKFDLVKFPYEMRIANYLGSSIEC